MWSWLLIVEWGLLLIAVGALLWPRLLHFSVTFLMLAYGLAFFKGQLNGWALISIGLLGCAAVLVRPKGKWIDQFIGHGLFVGLAVILSLHLITGFHNPA